MGYFDDRQTGDLMSVLNNDVGNLRKFGDAAFRGLRFLLQVVVSFAFMALLHWQLAILLALMPLVLAGLSYWYAVRVEPRYDAVRATIGSVNSRLEDSIDGITTVKAFGTGTTSATPSRTSPPSTGTTSGPSSACAWRTT